MSDDNPKVTRGRVVKPTPEELRARMDRLQGDTPIPPVADSAALLGQMLAERRADQDRYEAGLPPLTDPYRAFNDRPSAVQYADSLAPILRRHQITDRPDLSNPDHRLRLIAAHISYSQPSWHKTSYSPASGSVHFKGLGDWMYIVYMKDNSLIAEHHTFNDEADVFTSVLSQNFMEELLEWGPTMYQPISGWQELVFLLPPLGIQRSGAQLLEAVSYLLRRDEPELAPYLRAPFYQEVSLLLDKAKSRGDELTRLQVKRLEHFLLVLDNITRQHYSCIRDARIFLQSLLRPVKTQEPEQKPDRPFEPLAAETRRWIAPFIPGVFRSHGFAMEDKKSRGYFIFSYDPSLLADAEDTEQPGVIAAVRFRGDYPREWGDVVRTQSVDDYAYPDLITTRDGKPWLAVYFRPTEDKNKPYIITMQPVWPDFPVAKPEITMAPKTRRQRSSPAQSRVLDPVRSIPARIRTAHPDREDEDNDDTGAKYAHRVFKMPPAQLMGTRPLVTSSIIARRPGIAQRPGIVRHNIGHNILLRNLRH